MEQFRDYFEILYFLSGPVLVVIAYIALAQIKLAKNQIEVQRNATRISAKRDALRLTSEQIKEYGVTIIPIINTLDKKIENESIEFFEKSAITTPIFGLFLPSQNPKILINSHFQILR